MKNRTIDDIIQQIEDYSVVGAFGGSPFNSDKQNDKLRNDAVDNGRAEAHAALISLFEEVVGEDEKPFDWTKNRGMKPDLVTPELNKLRAELRERIKLL